MRNIVIAAMAALAVSGLLAVPLRATAQPVPSYATASGGGDGQIRGRITSFDGAYSLQVRDEKGYVDNVSLHPGTIINPTGLTLSSGMVVSILGYDNGPVFSANEIDTPYTYDGGVPYYAGQPWDYYGPSIGLGFYFGNSGWWHGDRFGGGYRYDNGARIYSNVRVSAFYRGGNFQGRNYVAPASRGGYVSSGHASGFARTEAAGRYGSGGGYGAHGGYVGGAHGGYVGSARGGYGGGAHGGYVGGGGGHVSGGGGGGGHGGGGGGGGGHGGGGGGGGHR
jgi:hypothetical protein